MIHIDNVDENVRRTGIHEYAIYINRTELCRFSHRREEKLSVFLKRAAKAAEEMEKDQKDDLIQTCLEIRKHNERIRTKRAV